MDLLVKNGKLVTEKGLIKADLAIAEGKITGIGCFQVSKDCRVLDASDKLVFPGIIDAHTHYGLATRGAVTADGWREGTRSAACGGVTTCIDYADPLPGKRLVEGAVARLTEAGDAAFIDYTLHMVIHRWQREYMQQLQELKEFGLTSLKIFTTYEQRLPEKELEQLLSDAKAAGLLVTVHAEDNELVAKTREELEQKGDTAPQNHGISRPAAAEARAVSSVLQAADKIDAPVYFVHVSSAEGAAAIAAARSKGQQVFGETCPHYLLLDDSLYSGDDPRLAMMTPPLRSRENLQPLWQALVDGTFQVVATDHCAYTPEQKREGKSCFDTLPGIPGSETLLPLLYSYGVGRGYFDACYLAYLLSTNPAKIFGLYPRKGCIRLDSDADLVIFDPVKTVKLDGSKLHSAAGYTPFAGFEVTGYPETTMLRGEIIYHQGEFAAKFGKGQFVKAEGVSSADSTLLNGGGRNGR